MELPDGSTDGAESWSDTTGDVAADANGQKRERRSIPRSKTPLPRGIDQGDRYALELAEECFLSLDGGES